jgi:hypothetical protein
VQVPEQAFTHVFQGATEPHSTTIDGTAAANAVVVRPRVARIRVEEGTYMLDWNERFERKQDEDCKCLK